MPSCVECGKYCKTLNGLEMHCRSVHETVCLLCNKAFKTANSKVQHFEAVHGPLPYSDSGERQSEDQLELPPPPVPSPGEWVPREQFKGCKSFGYFRCAGCSKTWMSAHAFKDCRQACQSCEVYSYPVFLWVNFNRGEDPRSIRDEGPHDRERCEACARGICTSAAKRHSF